MQVEDHPFDYRTFEGVIPKGNYGAGVVEIWDQGTYEHIDIKDPKTGEKQLLQDLEKGSIKIVLHGMRLQGEFALVKLKNDQKGHAWLLIKHRDAYSVETEYNSEEHTDPDSIVTEEVERRTSQRSKGTSPVKKKSSIKTILAKLGTEKKYTQFLHPMLAKVAEEPFSDKDWLFEVKWDGYRAIAEVHKEGVTLYSRNGLSFERKYPEVVSALSEIKKTMVLDGEIVVVDENGMPNFQYLQHYPDVPQGCTIMYYVFDLLRLNDQELLKKPLLERKAMLKKALELPDGSVLRYSEHVVETGLKFFDWVMGKNMEGMMAKRANSHYYLGKRSRDWLKVRNHLVEEVLIAGFTAPQGNRKYFGSLVLGMYKGGQLEYVGHVGTGFDEQSLEELHAQMKLLEQNASPFKTIPKESKLVTWIKPSLICNIKYTEKTQEGQFRHPVFMGLRIDKEPLEVATNEETKDAKNDKKTQITMESVSTTQKEGMVEVGGNKLKLSNLEKLYFPEDGITKGMIIDYYQSMQEYILPYLKDRPESLKRNPNGIKDEGFYHKDAGQEAPEWVKSFPIHSDSNNKDIDYILCNDPATLMYLNNLGCIELNPWNSRVKSLDFPDYMVLDMDPSDKNTFDQVIETILALKEILDKAGAISFCKTSGATGMHIYVPLGAKYTYEQARDFAHLLVGMVQERLPFTTLERSLTKRKDRIYLDYLQNRTGQTLSSVYSVRPKPGATVSTPLEWKEVKLGIRPNDFTIHNLAQRVKEKGDIFKGILGEGIDMPKCLENLQN
jgi:bifunctional non-homologous end joining protein LigD